MQVQTRLAYPTNLPDQLTRVPSLHQPTLGGHSGLGRRRDRQCVLGLPVVARRWRPPAAICSAVHGSVVGTAAVPPAHMRPPTGSTGLTTVVGLPPKHEVTTTAGGLGLPNRRTPRPPHATVPAWSTSRSRQNMATPASCPRLEERCERPAVSRAAIACPLGGTQPVRAPTHTEGSTSLSGSSATPSESPLPNTSTCLPHNARPLASRDRSRLRHNGQVTGLDYDLHKLGWRAFQDLCAVVLQQVLGQTFHTFADTNDGGRDGAFYGNWSINNGPSAVQPNAKTVAQCKFSIQTSGTLTPSMLEEELPKIEKLKSRGMCDAYIALTNLAVSGKTEEWLVKRLEQMGIFQSLVLDGKWICQQISLRPDLRRYVPRVYGLGDLGQILDDRRLRQARALLTRLEGDLATFVPTEAYKRSLDALTDSGFVLLLGEPACGKSTIAATLSLVALDEWKSAVRRVDSADELIAAWNPNEERQLFWVDDAFGSVRHDTTLTDSWSRRMDQVMTAISQGNRLILTSRDYIYRDAKSHLKEYAYPKFREHKVVIDVSKLDIHEKRRILYNHLKAGDQPAEILNRWKPYLQDLAAVDRFQPEVARRLSLQAFTPTTLYGSDVLKSYIEHPVQFLADVLLQLEPPARAALACVYISGDELRAPVHFTEALLDAITRLGASPRETAHAFSSMKGTFLQESTDSRGDPVWRFRHPTIREGFAAVIAKDINAVTILLDGFSDDELLREVDCGGPITAGTLVRVPTILYGRIAHRIRVPPNTLLSHPFPNFMLHRTSAEFLRIWSDQHRHSLDKLLEFGTYISAFWGPEVLGRLHKVGALPNDVRKQAVDRLIPLALELDGGWLEEPTCFLFTRSERENLLSRIRNEIIPNLGIRIDESTLEESTLEHDSSIDPASRYDEAEQTVKNYLAAFTGDRETQAILNDAMKYIEEERDRVSDDNYRVSDDQDDLNQSDTSRLQIDRFSAEPSFHRRFYGRDVFDDVDEGK